MKNISVILVEPETAGNIGAVARVMANFDCKNLVLINPKCDHLSKEAVDRASHAKTILKKAKVKPLSFLKSFHTLIATTSQLGRDYNIPRSPITPEQLNAIAPKKPKIALVFGRESHGLSNKEIDLCDFTLTIPTSKKYPVMNLSHSVNIILYELFKSSKTSVSSHIVFATKTEKTQLNKMVDSVLKRLKFTTATKLQTQKLIWKKILAKSFLTRRESYALMGFFRKLLE